MKPAQKTAQPAKPRSPAPPQVGAFHGAQVMAADFSRLRQLQRQLRQTPLDETIRREFDDLLRLSQATVAKRREKRPSLRYAGDLPVHERREAIARLISENQVVIVCGETGSGKTTQLPKICLQQGRGIRGFIGHTQPRRLAARSVAARLAQELQSTVGSAVGVKIRFHDRTSPDSYVKLMTDGILLAETQTDPLLLRYDTIIIDEAHERSLNIDFLLGYLHQLLPKRPDLKLIITSATIDAERFCRHFNDAPVIEVSGRLYPVEIRYRPIASIDDDDDERDLYDAIVDAVDELSSLRQGDILVFLPGEREIRESAEALRKTHFLGPPPEILPLFSRLSAQEQDRIFKPHTGRRIVLATNVAETSLTVPGIHFVVDSGLARVKRYSYRNKVEQLHVEKISQAAALQRSGRCGRVASGVCIRLYDEDDYNGRSAYTDPEILRSSLAGVILRMKSLRFGDVEKFPFLEPPPQKAINDAYLLLGELGAIDEANELTAVGHELARLPLDPRLARMIVAARQTGCLQEILIIAAALSVQDPRERPQERQQAADEKHRQFADEKSEFAGWIKLWNWVSHAFAHKESNRKLVESCHSHFLSYLRLREWRDVHSQLLTLVAEQGWRINSILANYETLHKALLSGLLGNIGSKSEESGHYLGARGIKFMIHPGSTLHKKAGKWVMAAELTETSRLFARCIARIEPEWIAETGKHLIRKSYFDPHWEKKAMHAVVFERTTLYGLVIDPRRRVDYAPLNPREARGLFIREALVAGEVDEAFAKHWPFFQHNRKLIAEIEGIEAKQRRQDVLVDDELIFAFYDHLLPETVNNGQGFDRWRKEIEKSDPRRLFLAREDLMRHEAAGVTSEVFPPYLKLNGVDYPLAYHFEPGSPRDGITLTLPLAQLNQINGGRCEWLVPGLLKEKVILLIKTLPQRIRAKLTPVPDFAAEFVTHCAPGQAQIDPRRFNAGIIPSLIDYILKARGLNERGWAVTADLFRLDALPPHFMMNFKLIDEHGRQLAMGRNLAQLRVDWGSEAKQEFSELHETPSQYQRLTDWTIGELPELLEVTVGQQAVIGFPALVAADECVSLQVFDSPEEAADIHRIGLMRLFQIQLREQVKYLEKNLPEFTALSMQFMALGSGETLKKQLIDLVFARTCLNEPLPRDEAAFRARQSEARPRLNLVAQEICRLIAQILSEWQTAQKKLSTIKAHNDAYHDIQAQIGRLIQPRFISETPFERLQHFPRYLKAAGLRIDKIKTDPSRDRRLLAEFMPMWMHYERRAKVFAKQGLPHGDAQLEQFRWLLEELRVNLFAQELKTPMPVSVKRLQKMWESLQTRS